MKESPARFADLAGLRLYRRNIFAVTGLPVDAQGRTVRRHRDRLDARLAVEETWPGDADSPVRGGHRKDEVRLAFEEFQDPRSRLVDELLWYWRDAELGCGCAPVTHERHDEAVFLHCQAIEAETGRVDISVAERARIWNAAAAGWAKLLSSPDLRGHLAHRLTALADPRLDDHSPDDFLPGLPRLLLSPFTELAGDRSARPRLAAACGGWVAQPAFATLLRDAFEEPVTEAVERVTEGLRLAGDRQDADRYWDALQVLQDRVLPDFEELEPLKPFAPESQYEELTHTLAAGLNNVALAIHTERGHSRFQKKKAVELMEAAFEIAPERDERQIYENLQAVYEQRVGSGPGVGARPGAAQQLKPSECLGCVVLLLTIVGGVIGGLTAGPAWAVGIVVGGLVLAGMFAS